MSKRRNEEENVVDVRPQCKRFRVVKPLQDSDVHNKPEDSKSEGCQSAEASTSVGSKAESSSVQENQLDLPVVVASALAGEAGSPSDEETQLERLPIGFSSLPTELQEAIIILSLTLPHGGFDFSIPAHYSGLARVCRLWESIVSGFKVFTTHEVWKCNDDEEPEIDLDDICQEIKDRDPRALQLGSLNATDDEDVPLRFPPQLIANSFPPSLQRLILTCVSARDLAAIPPLADAVPELLELVLRLYPSDIGDLAAPIRAFANAHKLERLTAVNAALAYRSDHSTPARINLDVPWDRIQTYLENRRAFDVEPIPSIFYAPRLDSLKTLVIVMSYYIDESSIQTLRKASLPNLESLAIEATPSVPGQIPGFEILEFIVAPRLMDLALIGHVLDFDQQSWKERDENGQRFINALSSLKRLHSLSLSFPRIPSKTLRTICDAVKGLKKFDIHVTASKEDFKGVFEELTVKDDTAQTLLPSLESFSFDIANDISYWSNHAVGVTKDDLFDLDSFSSFAKSRRGPNLPSGVTELKKIDMFTDWDEESVRVNVIDLELPSGVLTQSHIRVADYWYLKSKYKHQQFRFLERFSPLDDAFEAKQFFTDVKPTK